MSTKKNDNQKSADWMRDLPPTQNISNNNRR